MTKSQIQTINNIKSNIAHMTTTPSVIASLPNMSQGQQQNFNIANHSNIGNINSIYHPNMAINQFSDMTNSNHQTINTMKSNIALRLLDQSQLLHRQNQPQQPGDHSYHSSAGMMLPPTLQGQDLATWSRLGPLVSVV